MKLSSSASTLFLKQYLVMESDKVSKKPVEKLKIINFLEELRKSGLNISIFSVKDKWCEIDTPNDLEIARKIFT